MRTDFTERKENTIVVACNIILKENRDSDESVDSIMLLSNYCFSLLAFCSSDDDCLYQFSGQNLVSRL